MKKRILAMLLCIIMCLSLVSVTAFAEESNATGEMPVAKIGSTEYLSLEDAIKNVKNNETIEIIRAITCENISLPRVNGISYTIEGKVAGIVLGNSQKTAVYNYCVDNGHVDIKNVTIKVSDNDYQYFRNLSFSNCILIGRLCVSNNVSFESCTFYAPGTSNSGISSKNYSVWCYGENESYNNCKFYGSGKFINVYQESTNGKIFDITLSNCTFINEGNANKAAVNIKETCSNNNNLLQYRVVISNCTMEGKFPENSESTQLIVLKNGIFQVDDRTEQSIKNSSENNGIIVLVDGKQEYPVLEDNGPEVKSTYIIKDEASARELEALGVRVVMFDNLIALGLKNDVQANIVIEKDVKVSLNLNGYTLKNAIDGNTIRNYGTLTVSYNPQSDKNPNGLPGAIVSDSEKYSVINNIGTATVNSVTVSHTYTATTDSSAKSVISNAKNCSLTIDKNAEIVGIYHKGSTVGNEGTLIVRDSTITGGCASIRNGESATLIINGGNYKDAIHNIQNYGSMTIKNGTFNDYVSTYSKASNAGTATITGGTFNNDIRCSMQLKDNNWPDNKAEVNINNAVVYGKLTYIFIDNDPSKTTAGSEENQGIIRVYGGQYKYDPTDCLANDTICVGIENEMYVVGNHNFDEGVVTKLATDTEPGILTKTCQLGGETIEVEIPVDHEHVVSSAAPVKTAVDGSNKFATAKATCLYCGKEFIAETTYNCSSVTTKECTENHNGSHTVTFTFENESFGTVDKKITDHSYVYDVYVAPTCTENGYSAAKQCIYGKCNSNDKLRTVIPATGHTAGEPVEENLVESTCSKTGSYDSVVYCTVCGEELSRETVEIEKIAHNVITDEAFEATCTETGLTEGCHCADCGEVIVAQEEIPATGHNMRYAGKMNKQMIYRCSVCGEVEFVSIYAHILNMVSYILGNIR